MFTCSSASSRDASTKPTGRYSGKCLDSIWRSLEPRERGLTPMKRQRSGVSGMRNFDTRIALSLSLEFPAFILWKTTKTIGFWPRSRFDRENFFFVPVQRTGLTAVDTCGIPVSQPAKTRRNESHPPSYHPFKIGFRSLPSHREACASHVVERLHAPGGTPSFFRK